MPVGCDASIALIRLGTVASMAEVVETHDLTAPRRTAGRWTTASGAKTARNSTRPCAAGPKAHAAAESAANVDALAAIADRGLAAALEYAELVESPATHGAVLISIWFDQTDEGNLRRRVSYERAPG